MRKYYEDITQITLAKFLINWRKFSKSETYAKWQSYWRLDWIQM